jgi:hypothetical protein
MVIVWAASAPIQAQDQTTGLFVNEVGAFDGYTLFTPLSSTNTYLIDNAGKLVHSWESDNTPGLSVYFQPDGHLLRTESSSPAGVDRFQNGGAGGRIVESTWDGNLLWEYTYAGEFYRQHHDIERLPNGNVLIVAWEYKSYAEAVAAGRSTSLLRDDELWPDHLVEVQPSGVSSGTIVWEWHLWDHLIQDNDPTKANFGVVADHPELIDLNYEMLTGPGRGKADMNHVNSVDYNPALDQIILSSHAQSEIWVIDHSTTTAEAAGHSGGDSGMGGDLVYRWGNPEAYRAGDSTDRQLFKQHDAQWVEDGLPGAGNILVFNNGRGRPGGDYSSVDEIVPPLEPDDSYLLSPGPAYGPAAAQWSYFSDPTDDFFAQNLSGAQRLPNGNTLICAGSYGNFFEVTAAKDLVWHYLNPITGFGIDLQGDPIPPVHSNSAFRASRYAVDYPGLAGQDVTPGDPLEIYTKPLAVSDGSGGTVPMTVALSDPIESILQVFWESASCPSEEYNLIYGYLENVASYQFEGSACSLGTTGEAFWADVPAGDLFFLIVGTDSTGTYESDWGNDGSGMSRLANDHSGQCGVNYRDNTATCP